MPEGDQVEGERPSRGVDLAGGEQMAALARRNLRALGHLTGRGRRRTPDPLPAARAWELLRFAIAAWTARGIDPDPLYWSGILGHLEGLDWPTWQRREPPCP